MHAPDARDRADRSCDPGIAVCRLIEYAGHSHSNRLGSLITICNACISKLSHPTWSSLPSVSDIAHLLDLGRISFGMYDGVSHGSRSLKRYVLGLNTHVTPHVRPVKSLNDYHQWAEICNEGSSLL